MPVDPSYVASTGSAQRRLALTMAGLDYQQGQLGGTYGLGVNAQGGVFDDPSNPYSRAAALQESYRRAQLGNTTGMAARGQLYSGALQNAQNQAGRDYGQGRDALVRQFMAAQQQIQQGKLGASAAYEDAIAQAEAERIKFALQYGRP
jgi:hypothetical protein